MTDPVDDILGITANEHATARVQQRKIPLTEPKLHKLRATSRECADRSGARTARELFRTLPAPNESWHCIFGGQFDSYDLVDVIIDHGRIKRLYLATLGFNLRIACRLLEQMDAGDIGTAHLLVSMWFEADKRMADAVGLLARELPARGGWYCATRSHAKIIAAQLDDGRGLVIESSSNLRTCRSIEQLTITHSLGLYNFHAAWMEEARAEAQKQSQA